MPRVSDEIALRNLGPFFVPVKGRGVEWRLIRNLIGLSSAFVIRVAITKDRQDGLNNRHLFSQL